MAYQEPKKPTLPASRRRTDGVGRYSGEDYNRDALVQRRKSGRPATNGGQVVKTEPVDYSEDYGNDGLEPGEEFVPEEAQELTQEPNNNELARWIPRGHSLGSLSGNLFLVILTGLLFAYAAWWRAEKIDVGYCGVGGLGMLHVEIICKRLTNSMGRYSAIARRKRLCRAATPRMRALPCPC